MYGYPSEVHKIITEDGYILEVHRIANPGKQPVILTHGLLASSADWIINGPNHSLGKICHQKITSIQTLCQLLNYCSILYIAGTTMIHWETASKIVDLVVNAMGNL